MTQGFLVFTAAALFLCGVNWFLPVVHHPLYPEVGREAKASYETAYNRRIGLVIFLPRSAIRNSAVRVAACGWIRQGG